MIQPNSHGHVAVHWQDMLAIVHVRDAKLNDPLDIAAIHDELAELIESERPLQLLLNFGAVSRCSSEMISTLLKIRQLVLFYGCELKLCGLREAIREAYRILNLDGTVFDIYDSATDAIVAFAEQPERSYVL